MQANTWAHKSFYFRNSTQKKKKQKQKSLKKKYNYYMSTKRGKEV